MRSKQFTLTSVRTTPAASLLLRYADGEQFEVNLVETILKHSVLVRLKDPEVFRSAKVGNLGAAVIWANDGDLELAADNLRALAIEQAGGISHEFIWNWMARNDLTLDTVVQALGVSPQDARLLPQRHQARATHCGTGLHWLRGGGAERSPFCNAGLNYLPRP